MCIVCDLYCRAKTKNKTSQFLDKLSHYETSSAKVSINLPVLNASFGQKVLSALFGSGFVVATW